MTLQLQILQVLADAAGHPLLRSVLRLQVEARVRPKPMKAMFDDAIDAMWLKGLIINRSNELDDEDPFFLLDEKGEALVTKLRL